MVVERNHRAVGPYEHHVLVVPVPQSGAVTARAYREVADRFSGCRRQVADAVDPLLRNRAGVQAFTVLVHQVDSRRPVLRSVGKAHDNAGRGSRGFPLPPHQLVARLNYPTVEASRIVEGELIPLETAVRAVHYVRVDAVFEVVTLGDALAVGVDIVRPPPGRHVRLCNPVPAEIDVLSAR